MGPLISSDSSEEASLSELSFEIGSGFNIGKSSRVLQVRLCEILFTGGGLKIGGPFAKSGVPGVKTGRTR